MTVEGSTQAVPERLKIDVAALRRYLEPFLPDLSGEFEISKFTGGQSNPTYLIDSTERRFVLRRKPPGKVLSSAHAVDREARVMRAIADTGFPVPEVVHECLDASIIGSPFYVMTYLDGRIFWDPLLAAAQPADRTPIYFALTDALADLHAIDVDTAGLGDFGPRTHYYQRQIQRWSRQMTAVGDLPAGAPRLVDWLTSHLPEGEEVALVHGDYRLDNAVFAHHDAALIGVIDWELATLGDPMADLSYFLLNWMVPVNHIGLPTLAGADLADLCLPSAEAVIDRYFTRSRRRRPHSFAFHHAYNLFRVAAILRGITARHLIGNASNDGAAELDQLVGPILELAIDVATSRVRP